MPPLVSVLITIYNRERYLAAAVESVLTQSMQDFEVILVDDGSKDGSARLAGDYAAREPRIKFLRNERNLGDYPNRNRAASEASGKYLKYVDADDLLYPRSLAIMVDAMEKWPEAGLGLSWNVIDPPQPYPFVTSPREVIRGHFLGRGLLGVGPSAALIRRESFKAVGGFSGRQFIGDTELWLKLAQLQPVVSLPPALVWWRRHEGQQMFVEQANPEVLAIRYRLECETLESTVLLDEGEKRRALSRIRQHHARRLLALGLRRRHPAAAWRLFQSSGRGLGGLLRGCFPYLGG
jgi:glycosyltransferase involved in cell wall biosynthesis